MAFRKTEEETVPVPESSEVAIPATYNLLKNQLQLAATLGVDSEGNAGAMMSIIDRVMQAETVEEVLADAERGPTKVDDLLDKPLTFVDWQPMKSADQYRSGKSDSLDAYAAIAVIDILEGTEHVVCCGGQYLLAQLQKMTNIGEAFPFKGAFMGVETSSGYTVYKIRGLNPVERKAIGETS